MNQCPFSLLHSDLTFGFRGSACSNAGSGPATCWTIIVRASAVLPITPRGDDRRHIKQTRCVVCDAEHEYKDGKVPAQRRRSRRPRCLPRCSTVCKARRPRRLAQPDADFDHNLCSRGDAVHGRRGSDVPGRLLTVEAASAGQSASGDGRQSSRFEPAAVAARASRRR